MSNPDPSSTEPTYAVGYRRPPKSRRFKPGQSGNPNGRPKQQENLLTIFTSALTKKITVREKGSPRRLSKLEAMVEVMINKAVGGDPRALATVVKVAEKIDAFKYQSPETCRPGEGPKEKLMRLFENLNRVEEEEKLLAAGKIQDEASAGRDSKAK